MARDRGAPAAAPAPVDTAAAVLAAAAVDDALGEKPQAVEGDAAPVPAPSGSPAPPAAEVHTKNRGGRPKGYSPKKHKGGAHPTKDEILRQRDELASRLGVKIRGGEIVEPSAPLVPEVPVDPGPTIAALEAVLRLVFGVIARKQGPHWIIEDSENREIADPLGRMLAPYTPQLGFGLDWLVGGGRLFAAVEKRMDIDNARSAEKRGALPSGSPAPADAP